ncbi:MAG TPA: neuromedin U [Woeseiaceae bacterium]|nr:neuromedin U [Woeseiaceae bacterium]
MRFIETLALVGLLTVAGAPSAFAQGGDQAAAAAALAKAAQNPVADLVSVPMQLNMNFGMGPEDDVQEVLNIQPVLPFSLNDDWNLITRTIVPLISQPDFGVYPKRENGIGDIQLSGFLSPKAVKDGLVWGVGAVAQLNTATDDRLGQGAWGIGPTAVVLKLGNPWVFGALVNNVWSVSEDSGRGEVNQFLLQPFVNYNFPSSPGRYLTFAPIITADWEAESSERWLVPIGLGIGQITRFGKQAVNLQASLYYNVVSPDAAPEYQVRLQLQLMFPK